MASNVVFFFDQINAARNRKDLMGGQRINTALGAWCIIYICFKFANQCDHFLTLIFGSFNHAWVLVLHHVCLFVFALLSLSLFLAGDKCIGLGYYHVEPDPDFFHKLFAVCNCTMEHARSSDDLSSSKSEQSNHFTGEGMDPMNKDDKVEDKKKTKKQTNKGRFHLQSRYVQLIGWCIMLVGFAVYGVYLVILFTWRSPVVGQTRIEDTTIWFVAAFTSICILILSIPSIRCCCP